MSCLSPESKPDWKAYALGELNPEARVQAEAHAATCSACSEELAALRLTLEMMSTLREEEIPRRIAFVSDKVFEPRWWQRMFSPTFASACVIAVAILAHGLMRPANTDADVDAAVARAMARFEVQQVNAEVANRMQIEDVKQLLVAGMGFQRR